MMFNLQEESEQPIPIWSVTLERFTSPGGQPPKMADQNFCETTGKKISERAFLELQEFAPEMINRRVSSNVDGYSIAHLGENWHDGVIAVWEDSSGKIVGGQYGGVPYVLPEHRGKKLGREIQLCAFENGLKTIDSPSFFSPEGFAARKSAHRFAVERAVEQGVDVPAEVVEDYPYLKAQPSVKI